MSALDNLKEQVKERFVEAWGKIQESPTYNTLREKFEALSPNAQRGIISGAIFVAALMLLSIPYSYFSASSDFVTDFEKNRGLVRALLRASRMASEASSAPQTVSAADLKSRIQSELTAFPLLPEQIAGVIDLNANDIGKPLAPASLTQEGVGVSLKKLNLKQVVEIGFQLQGLSPTVKLTGVDVTATQPDPHYFDVLYKLVTYSLPGGAAGGDEEESAPSGRPRPRGGKPAAAPPGGPSGGEGEESASEEEE